MVSVFCYAFTSLKKSIARVRQFWVVKCFPFLEVLEAVASSADRYLSDYESKLVACVLLDWKLVMFATRKI